MRPVALRALIVDDERLARDSLRQLLAAHPDIAIVAEARDAAEAHARLAATHPDLMFLDIQMPGSDGLEMLERLEDPPLTIFTTAHDAHALRAIELSALDYLLKPVPPQRLAQALDRARQRFAALAAPPPASAHPLQQVFVREGERCWLVRLADIQLLQSEGNYTRVFFSGHRPLIPRALTALEPRLDPALFFRANRGEIVGLRWIAAIEPEMDGGYWLRLREAAGAGPEIKVSRRQARRFRELLSL